LLAVESLGRNRGGRSKRVECSRSAENATTELIRAPSLQNPLRQSRSSKEDNQKNADALNLHALRPNENKLSYR
jgi:hypothetical protein